MGSVPDAKQSAALQTLQVVERCAWLRRFRHFHRRRLNDCPPTRHCRRPGYLIAVLRRRRRR